VDNLLILVDKVSSTSQNISPIDAKFLLVRLNQVIFFSKNNRQKSLTQTKLNKQNAVQTNSLWRIRRVKKLEQKQVASLLGHKSSDKISKYEGNNILPKLETTIKLMIIYNSTPKEMFPDLFECCRKEVENSFKKYSESLKMSTGENFLENLQSCTYEDLFKKSKLSQTDKDLLRGHVTKLARKIAYL
jgi:transcriptional regulator with XRE-family HTH domain